MSFAAPRAYTTDEMLKVTEEQAKRLVSEEKRKGKELLSIAAKSPVVNMQLVLKRVGLVRGLGWIQLRNASDRLCLRAVEKSSWIAVRA